MKLLPLAIAVFYPLIHEQWAEGPLTAEKTSPPFALSYLDDAEVEAQADLYGKFEDPAIRSRIVRELESANNPSVLTHLERFASKEKNERVLADLLQTILRVSERFDSRPGNLPLLKELLLHSENPSVRAGAASLLPAKDLQAVEAEFLMKESVPFVIAEVFRRVETDAPLGVAALKRLAQGAQSASSRAAALRLYAKECSSPGSDVFLQKVVREENDPVFRVRLAEGLAGNASSSGTLLSELARDGDVQVRLAVAGIRKLSLEKEKILQGLTADPDSPGIRERACRSLAGTKNRDSLKCLIAALADSSRLVREAARDSLVESNPKETDIRDGIVASAVAGKEKASESLQALDALAGKGCDLSDCVPALSAILKDPAGDAVAVDTIRTLSRVPDLKLWKEVKGFASSSSPEMRLAVIRYAAALNDPEMFPELKALAKDSDAAVQTAALGALVKIADPYFHSVLSETAGNPKISTDARAAACRALAGFDKMESNIPGIMEKIALVPYIPVMMAPPAYDADYVRISAILVLLEAGRKGDQTALDRYHKIMEHLRNPNAREREQGIVNPVFLEYLRQVRVLEKGEEPKAVQVPSCRPELSVRPFEEKE